MTAQTLTLSDFLLARITEEQRHAEALAVTMRSDAFTAPASLVGVGAIVDPARVLAECAAKRQIVEWDAGQYVGYGILEILASVYADHPDYRREWRP